jgi:hypothetical protein
MKRFATALLILVCAWLVQAVPAVAASDEVDAEVGGGDKDRSTVSAAKDDQSEDGGGGSGSPKSPASLAADCFIKSFLETLVKNPQLIEKFPVVVPAGLGYPTYLSGYEFRQKFRERSDTAEQKYSYVFDVDAQNKLKRTIRTSLWLRVSNLPKWRVLYCDQIEQSSLASAEIKRRGMSEAEWFDPDVRGDGPQLKPGAPRAAAPKGMKKCRFCAEMIRAEAVKCRFCGSNVKRPADATEE